MSVANTDYIQATIELFGFIITVIVAVIFWIITGNEHKSAKELFKLLLLSGLALLFDAGWYIFDGNVSTSAVIINRMANLLIFLCNPIIVIIGNRYFRSLFAESDTEPNKYLSLSVYGFAVLAILIPISNIFYKWMYYFDNGNVYIRMNGWYLYTALNSMGVIMCLVTVMIYSKHLSLGRRVGIYIFLLAPFVGIVIQAASIGISFIQIGAAIGCLGIVASYLVEWIHEEGNRYEISDDRQRLWIMECVFALMILFVSAAIISCVVSVNKVSIKNSQQSSTSLTFMVNETINGALEEPIVVSRTMAQTPVILEALSTDELRDSEAEAEMLRYMRGLKQEYDYQMIFVASEKNKAFYTYDGFSRIMQTGPDEMDAWYNEFKGSGAKYELNIDEDKDNDMSLAVFVNMEIRGDNGELLGVCGVATSIESLMDILSKYEKDYGLDILLTDADGIIQVATDREVFHQKVTYDLSENGKSEKINYNRQKGQAVLTKFMPGFRWYLVVTDTNPDKLKIHEIVLPSMVIYVIGVIFMIVVSVIFGIHEKRRDKELKLSRELSGTDGLTGLKNRHAMDRFVGRMANEKMSEDIVVLMLDINGLKYVNDNIGHDAGDELIKGAAECMVKVFGTTGEIYRTGGDEFVIICLSKEEPVKELVKEMDEVVAGWKGELAGELAISVGMASHEANPDCTFAELMKKADGEMYKNKNAYYERTGKARRIL